MATAAAPQPTAPASTKAVPQIPTKPQTISKQVFNDFASI
ncbi:hypothetical protein SAMN05444398_1246 [Roseovarius pacificus]|uniref:Uncharacterized protein n=1 Tax=Roseovarius pacificus TaxID=337701 RepID=A0A1M7K2Q1_9RHOB|nr:hypothetical protein SAMN05444398_1246 [Roseovarius pacificus]